MISKHTKEYSKTHWLGFAGSPVDLNTLGPNHLLLTLYLYIPLIILKAMNFISMYSTLSTLLTAGETWSCQGLAQIEPVRFDWN